MKEFFTEIVVAILCMVVGLSVLCMVVGLSVGGYYLYSFLAPK